MSEAEHGERPDVWSGDQESKSTTSKGCFCDLNLVYLYGIAEKSAPSTYVGLLAIQTIKDESEVEHPRSQGNRKRREKSSLVPRGNTTRR